MDDALYVFEESMESAFDTDVTPSQMAAVSNTIGEGIDVMQDTIEFGVYTLPTVKITPSNTSTTSEDSGEDTDQKTSESDTTK